MDPDSPRPNEPDAQQGAGHDDLGDARVGRTFLSRMAVVSTVTEELAAKTLSRGVLALDLVTRPTRRDFTTTLSVETAFIKQGIDFFAKKIHDAATRQLPQSSSVLDSLVHAIPIRSAARRLAQRIDSPELAQRLTDFTGIEDTVLSRSSHQMRPRKLRSLMLTVPGAVVGFPLAVAADVISYSAIRMGFNFDAGAKVRTQAQMAAMRKAGTTEVNPAGSTPGLSPGIQARLERTRVNTGVASARAAQIRATPGHPSEKIKKVVVIMMENHTYDDFFGRMPGGNGTNDLFTAEDPPKYAAAWWPTHGKFSARFDRWMSVHEQHDPAQLPYHWENAKKYALLDDHHAADDGPSTANHVAQVAGWSHNMLNNYYTGLIGNVVKHFAGQPEIPPFDIDSMPAHLEAAGITWANYGNGAFAVIQGLDDSPNNLPSQQFALDARAGKLRQVSYVVPPTEFNEHAPNPVWTGMAWVKQQMDALVEGNNWDEVAVLLTWDDFGGYHDHVEMPELERWVHDPRYNYALGRRVPLIVMGPWVKGGYLWRQDADKGVEEGKHRSFLSVPQFLGSVFGLGDIEWSDDRPEYARTGADNLMGVFDFNQAEPLGPPDVPLPARPSTSVLRRMATQWQEAGQVKSLGEVRGLVDFKLGYHEALTRRILERQRAEMAPTLNG